MKVFTYNNVSGSSLVEIQGVKNISFAPEVDISGSSVIANSFEFDTKDLSNISIGYWAVLMDHNGSLWYASYIITDIQKIDGVFLRVKAESALLFLDKKTLPATSFSDEPISDVITDIFDLSGLMVPTVPSAKSSSVVTGFATKQTARERLAWVLITSGMFIRDCYVTGMMSYELLVQPVSNQNYQQYMMPYHIFYKPKQTYQSYITGINITAFGFSTPTAQSTETVTDSEGDTYAVTRYEYSVTNQNVPETAVENTIDITDCMLVTRSNVSDILTRLASYYFNRDGVELDCINNNQDYKVGERYKTYIDKDIMVEGLCTGCNYKLGHQIRSTMTFRGMVAVSSGKLTVLYKSQTSPNPPGVLTVAKKTYHFPVGYQYTVQTEWVDVTIGNYRYVLRPASSTVTGTMSSSDVTVTVQCYVCLIYDRTTKVLDVISVDEVTRTSTTEDSETIYIAEIE